MWENYWGWRSLEESGSEIWAKDFWQFLVCPTPTMPILYSCISQSCHHFQGGEKQDFWMENQMGTHFWEMIQEELDMKVFSLPTHSPLTLGDIDLVITVPNPTDKLYAGSTCLPMSPRQELRLFARRLSPPPVAMFPISIASRLHVYSQLLCPMCTVAPNRMPSPILYPLLI